jgi:peptide/nickel transport system permease protein
MKPTACIILLAVLAGITLFRYPLILESCVSLLGTVLLFAGGSDAPGIDWNPSLTEFRIAAVMWVATLIGLGIRAIRGTLRRKNAISGYIAPEFTLVPMRTGIALAGTMAFVSLTSPFLVPYGPDIQGDLTQTRLLPPFSTGRVTVLLRTPDAASSVLSGVNLRVRQANDFLLHRQFLITAGPEEVNGARERLGRILDSYPMLFVCGTDDAGRDVYSRVIYGTRVSVGIGLAATLGALILGLLAGIGAGMSGSIADMLVMRFTDLMLSIPGVFIIIGFMAFVSQSAFAIILVLSLTGWMHIARIVRNETLSLREREYVLAARLLRIPTMRIIRRHLLPNMSHVVSSAIVLQFANAVLGEATLGFLGLGIQAPTASWGNMIGEGTAYLGSAWWIGVFPGMVLSVVLIAAHRAAEEMERGSIPEFQLLVDPTARIHSPAQ